MSDSDAPCQCHDSWAYITNIHGGHCCFFPAGKTCHAAEVAAWEAERDRRNNARAVALASPSADHYEETK